MVYRFYENGVGHVQSEILGSCKMSRFQGFSPYAELRMKLSFQLAFTPSLTRKSSAPFSLIVLCKYPSALLFWTVKPKINNRHNCLTTAASNRKSKIYILKEILHIMLTGDNTSGPGKIHFYKIRKINRNRNEGRNKK